MSGTTSNTGNKRLLEIMLLKSFFIIAACIELIIPHLLLPVAFFKQGKVYLFQRQSSRRYMVHAAASIYDTFYDKRDIIFRLHVDFVMLLAGFA